MNNKFCTNCGQKLNEDQKFCVRCGVKTNIQAEILTKNESDGEEVQSLVITHQQFVQRYNDGSLHVFVDKNKAGDLVLSQFGQRRFKPAHKFWSWTGVILTIPLSIILLFVNGLFAIISFIVGLVIVSNARESAVYFCIQNMLESEDFFDFILLHGGARIKNNQGEELKSAFLEKMK